MADQFISVGPSKSWLVENKDQPISPDQHTQRRYWLTNLFAHRQVRRMRFSQVSGATIRVRCEAALRPRVAEGIRGHLRRQLRRAALPAVPLSSGRVKPNLLMLSALLARMDMRMGRWINRATSKANRQACRAILSREQLRQ